MRVPSCPFRSNKIRDDVEALTQYIPEHYDYEVGLDETDELGVFVGEIVTGEYKYKRSVRSSEAHVHK